MDDEAVKQRIEELVGEEQRLWDAESDRVASTDERARLEELGVQLDQLWDLLRQRRALRQAGKDPGDASVRPPETVETYEQ